MAKSQKKGTLSLEAPLVAVVEVASEAARAGVVDVIEFIDAVGVEGVESAILVLIGLVEDEISTTSVFVELALVLAELASLPPSPH